MPSKQLLTDTAIRNAKPTGKPLKIPDSGGLYLLITPGDKKLWRFRYRFEGKDTTLALGSYPKVPLAGKKDLSSDQWIDGARDMRDQTRRLLGQGIDLTEYRKAKKASKTAAKENSFEVVAREWHAKQSKAWAPSTAAARLSRMEKEIFPALGQRPIHELTALEILKVLRQIESRGVLEVAQRARQILSQVFRYSIATGRAERDPAADLRGALATAKTQHHPAITEPKAVGGLMRAIDGYQGEPVTQAALSLAPLVFVRPGELRLAEWDELDLDEGMWRIPVTRMKMDDEHLVPLSKQAVKILRELHPFTGKGDYVFPSIRSLSRPMSENTINAALRRLGYSKKQMTSYGFRTTASTLLNEQGWNRDVIERQLAHAERNAVRDAYARAERLPERRKMMQAWANHLDQLAAGGEVVDLKKRHKRSRNE